jgi:hypothetical protein
VDVEDLLARMGVLDRCRFRADLDTLLDDHAPEGAQIVLLQTRCATVPPPAVISYRARRRWDPRPRSSRPPWVVARLTLSLSPLHVITPLVWFPGLHRAHLAWPVHADATPCQEASSACNVVHPWHIHRHDCTSRAHLSDDHGSVRGWQGRRHNHPVTGARAGGSGTTGTATPSAAATS